MEIHGTITGDVKSKSVVANESKDGKMLQVEVRFGMTQSQTAKACGAPFAEDAFASLRSIVTSEKNGDGTERLFTWGTLKPTKKITCAQHRVTFTGDVFKDASIELQPKLLNIKTIEGAEKIVMALRLEIPTDKRKLSQLIEDACGASPVRIKFEPLAEIAPELPLRVAK